MNKRTLKYFILFPVLLAPSSAFANVTMEFYTYGGFGPVTSALNKVALIFGDGAYQGLFFSAAVLGLFMGGMMFFMKAIAGTKASMGAWLFSVGAGVTLYLALIMPKGTLQVYDPVLNQTQAIGGIPDGVVMVSGLLNKIERGLVDIVSNTADPVGYQSAAGGANFDILNNVTSKGVLLSDQYMNLSLQNYVQDCVFFEMQRPGTILDMNQLASNSDFLPIFNEAASGAIYTTYYTAANPSGTAMNCSAAWAFIQGVLTNPNSFTGSINARCADSGFDPTIPTELANCQSLIANTVNWLEGASYAATDVFRQTVMAQTISNAATQASPDTAMSMMANKNAGTSMMGTAAMANQWLPIIRAVLTATAFCMIPLLALFVPTPLFSKALGATIGFFLWITVWGVIDAILHQFATDYASTVFSEIKQYQLGVTAVMNFSTIGTKTLAAFAMIRWAGLMLSTVLVGMLVKFGGAALAQLSGTMTGHVQSAGAQAGHGVITPEGKAQTLGSLENAPGVMANAHKWDYQTRADARTFEGMSKMGASIQKQSDLGGGGQAAEREAHANALEGVQKTRSTEKTAGAMGDKRFEERLSDTGAAERRSKVTMSEAGAKAFGDISQEEYQNIKSGKMLDNRTAAAVNKSWGFTDAEIAAGKGAAKAGMNVDAKGLAIGSHGELMVTKVTGFDKDGKYVEIANGKQTRQGTLNGPQEVLAKAKELEADGHGYAARGLMHMVSKKDGGTADPGKGIRSDEAVEFRETMSLRGQHAVFEAKHGTETKWTNLEKRDSGSKVDSQSRNVSGNVNKYVDENTSTVDHGQTIGHGLQMVMNKDKSFARGLTNAKNDNQRQAAITSMAQSLGSDIKDYMSRSGKSLDFSKAEAGVNAKAGFDSPFGGASISGTAAVGGMRQDEYQTNLMNRSLVDNIDKADSEATRKGLKGDAHSQYVTDKMYNHVEELTNKLKENHPGKFGASTGPNAAIEAYNKLTRNDGGKDSNDKNKSDVEPL